MEVDERRTPDDELGPVLAAGRDATVHALGEDRVLRRTPSAERDLRTESEVMEHVRAQGYPVPQVFRVGPGEMVLERIEGPTMLEAIEARVWQVDPVRPRPSAPSSRERRGRASNRTRVGTPVFRSDGSVGAGASGGRGEPPAGFDDVAEHVVVGVLARAALG